MKPQPSLLTILVVDDEASIVALLQEVLEDEGYHVLTAPDGRAALDVTRTYPVDLVLTDLMMPHLDGMGLCLHLRADPRTAQIPIIAMSAATQRLPDRLFTAFLGKPFNVEDVLVLVAHMLA